jgi:ferrous iron transport protein B
MARAAYLMDRLMSRAGLSGKSFIPLLSSLACAVPGIMATRVIEDRRDRLATILVAPLMSCSARLPVYVLLIGAFLTDGYPWWVPGLTMFGLYAIGLVVAPLVAFVLKRTLLKGRAPLFVMEMPLYKRPALRTVLHRMGDAATAFLKRAGTLILASMVLVWALLYFPSGGLDAQLRADVAELRERLAAAPEDEKADVQRQLTQAEADLAAVEAEHLDYDKFLAREQRKLKGLEGEAKEEREDRLNQLNGAWKRRSALGRLGRAIEPAVRPLGWDWKVGTAVLASFPAREVVVGTLGIIYNEGQVDSDEIRKAERVADTPLGKALAAARHDDDPARRVFTVPAALSLLVFFALCCQCASTLAVIRRETKSWAWPAFTFAYMTALAYLGALLVYQVGSAL